MALKGELLSADLSNVFQMLAMNGKRGLLSVQDRVNPVARRRFFLDGQTVLPADPVAQRPSLAMLVEMGRVTYEQYASAMQRARRFNSDAWGILKAQGTIGDADAEAFRVRASNEALLEVFLWRDIRFSLDESVTQAPIKDASPIQIDHVIMEAARRQDEWRHIVQAVGSHREVFRRCQDNADLSELSNVEKIVYEFINGSDSAPEIETRCELPQYFVDLSLASLLNRGLIARLGPEELIMNGDKMILGGQVREGIRLFHCALRSDRSNPAIHRRLTDAHVRVGEFARACGHLRYCAVMKMAEGNGREAVTLLQEAWKLLPTQFSTLERILSILIQDPRVLTKEDRNCVADGRRLLQVWHDTGELERAVELATRIWAIDQSDREVLHTASRLNLRLGRVESAVNGYLTLAQRHRDENNLRGALDIYRTIGSVGGNYAKAYDKEIQELRGELERVAARKRRGRSLRLGLAATAVLVLLYGGYVWFGEQVVKDLDERLAAEPASRDALIPSYSTAAFWFKLAPAGMHAEQRAETMAAESEAERAAQIQKNEAIAAKIAAQQRIADERVAEGLRMVKAGDLPGAAVRLKEGLDSFPSRESAAASRAAKALDDVQRYLEQGRALLDEARTLEVSDPDAAFRLRLKVIRDFELIPEVKTLKLTLRIESVPPDARLAVQGTTQDYTAPIGIEVGGQGLLALEARAPGFLPRTFSLNLPPEFATWTLVLERAPRKSLKTPEPLVGAAPVDGSLALLAARNGPLFLVDAASGSITETFQPDSIDSQSRVPTVSGSRVLCLLDDGRARVVELPGFEVVRSFRMPVRSGVKPIPLDGGWVVATAPNRLEVLDRGGTVTRKFVLAKNVIVKDLCAVDGIVYCAAGEAGILSVDPKTDAAPKPVSPRFAASIAPGPRGSLIVHRPQAGVMAVDPAGGRDLVLFSHSGDSGRVHRVTETRWVAQLDGELVFLTESGPAGRVRVRGARADGPIVMDSVTGNAGVIVDGWCSVYDFSDGRCVSGFACEPGASPAFVQRTLVNVHTDGRVTLTDP
jgi:hypothetical protein